MVTSSDHVCSQQARRLFATRGRDRLTHKEKQCFLRFFAKGYPTAATFAAQGLTDDLCPAGCGQTDSIQHRLWHCPKVAQERQDLWPHFQHAGARLAFKHLGLIAKCIGLQKARQDLEPTHEHEPVAMWDGAETDANGVVFDTKAPTYIDGSCVYPTDRRLARAAYAARQARPDGKYIQIVGAVPANAPQTATFAEHLGATIFRVRAAPNAVGVVDCNSVITAAAHRDRIALGHHVHSDLWGEVDKGAVFRKTKAHRTVQEARAQGDLDDFMGNDAVDQLCRAKAIDLLPQQWRVNAYMAECDATRACNRFVAQMLAVFTDAQAALFQRAKEARKEKSCNKPSVSARLLRPTYGNGIEVPVDGFV